MTKTCKQRQILKTALYCRLSREDGDRAESDSIGNQKSLLLDYLTRCPELGPAELYIDDGYTGTSFDRPDFRRMVADIEGGCIGCVIVKDLSRFGRDYIETGRYLERWLPEQAVRFIAINDNIDSDRGAYDMLLPVKNVFNAQYAKDISIKVKSAIHAKQRRGEFIGAFAPYGYQKDPADRNHLIPDPDAAKVVRRIFSLFESGMGKVRIAKTLNTDHIPSPGTYKRLIGEHYCNGRRLDSTDYWTYATIHRMLRNQTYAGALEQGRDARPVMHGKTIRLDNSLWTVVSGTHEAIIEPERFRRVQELLRRRAYEPVFIRNVSPFAGFLKCGDCGRAMSKTNAGGHIRYTCGSYKRYGSEICSPHYLSGEQLEKMLLNDLNHLISAVPNLDVLAEAELQKGPPVLSGPEDGRLGLALERTRRLQKSVYEDYAEGILPKEEYLCYRADYVEQAAAILSQLEQISESKEAIQYLECPWISALLKNRRLDALDRITVAETVNEIRVFEGGRIEIEYRFSEDLAPFLDSEGNGKQKDNS